MVLQRNHSPETIDNEKGSNPPAERIGDKLNKGELKFLDYNSIVNQILLMVSSRVREFNQK